MPRTLLAILILFTFPININAQTDNQPVLIPVIEIGGGEEISKFSPANKEFRLDSSSLSAGLKLITASSSVMGKFGLNQGDAWGYHINGKADINLFCISKICNGVGGLLFWSNNTERVFSSSEPPSFDFNGETKKRFVLLGLRSGIGNYAGNYLRLTFDVGVERVIIWQKLYVDGRLTDNSLGFPREDRLALVGFGFNGSTKIWENIRLSGSFVNLNIVPKLPNLEKLFPSKNSVVEISLDLYESKYINFGVSGSWTDHPYGPVIAQKTAGIKIGLLPKKF